MTRWTSTFSYLRFIYQQSGSWLAAWRALTQPETMLGGYPGNHRYSIRAGTLYPSLQLFQRWQKIQPLIPPQATSLIDLACCRGYYVLQSSKQNHMQQAIGIDISQGFIDQARLAATLSGVDSKQIHFENSTLDAFLDAMPDKQDDAFDVVLLTGAYHYFYWGSNSSNQSFGSHDAIFSRLVRLCRHTLIISARLETKHLSASTDKAYEQNSEKARLYTQKHFLEAAKRYFEVEIHGSLGRYPIYVMRKPHADPPVQTHSVQTHPFQAQPFQAQPFQAQPSLT